MCVSEEIYVAVLFLYETKTIAYVAPAGIEHFSFSNI